MNKFSTGQENFIAQYKFSKAKIKNIDLDIDEYAGSIKDVKRLEELKQKYIARKTSRFIAEEFNTTSRKIEYKVSLMKKLILQLECE